MDNIVNLSDKRKTKDPATPKEDLLRIISELQKMIDENLIEGIASVAVGKDGKVYSITGGEFDILPVIGAIETLKLGLMMGSGVAFEDD